MTNQKPPVSVSVPAPELELMLEAEDVSLEERAEIRAVVIGQDACSIPLELVDEVAWVAQEPLTTDGPVHTLPILSGVQPEHDGQHGHVMPSAGKNVNEDDVRNTISKMKLPGRIKLAMFGNATARGLLIRDPNRIVQQFVLKNPRIQLRELEDFARNPNLSEQVLRTISSNAAWTKSYLVKLHLCLNPKTPSDLAVKWVKYLNQTDVRKLAKSKNVPQVVVTTARRRLEEMQKK